MRASRRRHRDGGRRPARRGRAGPAAAAQVGPCGGPGAARPGGFAASGAGTGVGGGKTAALTCRGGASPAAPGLGAASVLFEESRVGRGPPASLGAGSLPPAPGGRGGATSCVRMPQGVRAFSVVPLGRSWCSQAAVSNGRAALVGFQPAQLPEAAAAAAAAFNACREDAGKKRGMGRGKWRGFGWQPGLCYA